MDQIFIKCSQCGKIIPNAKYLDAEGDIVYLIEMNMCECKLKNIVKNIVERRKRDLESEVRP